MRRIVIIGIWAIIQIILYLYFFLVPATTTAVYLLQIIIGILLALYILSDDTKMTTSKLSWITIVLAFPAVGTILYLLFGIGQMTSYKKRVLESSKIRYNTEKSELSQLNSLSSRKKSLVNYLDNMNYRTAYLQKGSNFKTYDFGQDFFEDIIQDIRRAKEYIHLEFYIIKEGILFDKIIEELILKAKQGIEIRIISDFVGGRSISLHTQNKLKQNNIHLVFFNQLEINVLSKITNFRDHRKIVVIDGSIAYTGGFNIGDEYIDLDEYYGHWQDFAIRIADSSAVLEYETFFAQHWYFETKENLFIPKYYPSIDNSTLKGDTFIYPYVDGPDSAETFIRDMFIKTIMVAKERVLISTPYLIPDSVLLDSIILQARSGVQITIITPGLPDKKIVKLSTESYYRDLLKVGVKIVEYKGFIHSKKLMVDDDIAIVGTANFDMRSFNLSFEVCTLLMNGPVLKEISDIFEDEIVNSNEVIYNDYEKQNLFKRALQVILRLFAPLF
ncbi:cardiolipin synthase [Mycoplasma sp. P36-A1]|uniref:cardiolipin synthase n=1 Tax=Mycoplasma sp. P36-A1 TaxID=3252900 RepID=UPI003C30E52B